MKQTAQSNDASIFTEELLRRARNGDPTAMTTLYESTNQDVYRAIHAMVRDEQLVLDIQQDTYLRVFEHLDQLKEPERFPAWIHRIAVNEAKNQLSRKKPLLFSELGGEEDGEPELFIPDNSPLPEEVLSRTETSRLVDEILKTLTPEQQLVVGMYYYEQIPAREIAESLGVSAGTVHKQLHRGRKKIEAGVRALEKKGIKLYGLSPITFLLNLLKNVHQSEPGSRRVMGEVLLHITKNTVFAGMRFGRGFFETIVGKFVLGVLAVATVGGGVFAYKTISGLNAPVPIGDFRPSTVETTPQSLSDNRKASEPVKNRATQNRGSLENSSDISSQNPTLPSSPTEPAQPDEPKPDEPQPVEPQPNAPQPDEPQPDELQPVEPQPNTPQLDEPQPDEPQPDTPLERYSGSFGSGDSLHWSFDPVSGALTISGSGKIQTSAEPDTPWTDYRSQITGLTVEEGVTEIDNRSFRSYTALNSVQLPQSLRRIGEFAFCDCTGLKSITLPNTLQVIADGAFSNAGLTQISLPSSVTELSLTAFDNCFSLTSISVDAGNPSYSSQDGMLLDKTGTKLLRCPPGKAGSVSLPSGVSTVGSYAFDGCSRLTGLSLGGELTSFGSGAFRYCSALSALELPSGIRAIPQEAFSGCSGLTELRIPEGVTEIGRQAFAGCSGLKTLVIPGSVTSIGDGATSNASPTIYGESGSAAEDLAVYDSLRFISLSGAE